MVALQVKSFPDDLHARLTRRAKDDGVTVAEYVTRLLRRDLERPTIQEWLAAHPAGPSTRSIDVARVLDEVRLEYAPDPSPTPTTAPGATTPSS